MKNDSIGNITTANQTDWEKLKAMPDAEIIHDADSPATTEADWAQAFVCKNATELHTETLRRSNNVNTSSVKEQVAIGFDVEVLAYFRATGDDWKNRVNDALKEWLKEHAA